MRLDYDWIVIGSGFGGSVAALRLAEKGYRVAVLECGRRYRDEDFAESTWNFRRYYWMPKIGLRGIFRMTVFKDVFIVSGSGVGGGSLGYANTLYRARPAFFRDPQWDSLGDWESALDPHYETAERMLGVTDYPLEGPADLLLKEYGEQIGVGDTYKHTRVGAFFGEPGKEVPDPYFGGDGPARSGCIGCGSCMVGCRYNAKNTLVKNYLWFAEQLGVEILPERQVTDVRSVSGGAADGSDGYEVTSERSGSWLRKRRSTLTARGVVIAAGALGHKQAARRLPSPRLAAADLLPARRARAHQQRVDQRGHRAERRAGLREVGGDQLEHLSGSGHAHRGRDLRAPRRLHELPVHAPDRAGDEAQPATALAGPDPPASASFPAPALALPMVAAHGDPAGDADARQRDPAATQATTAGARA